MSDQDNNARLHAIAEREIDQWREADDARITSPEMDRIYAMALFVARLTDPQPIADCLKRIAGERGGKRWKAKSVRFDDVYVYADGAVYLADKDNDVVKLPTPVTTAGELHRLLDAMGVGR